jgi:protein-disulfide isomerase
MRYAALAALCLSLLTGAVLSGLYLAHVWFPDAPTVCTVNRYINCEASSASIWGWVGPIPIALLGLCFYLAAFALLRRPTADDTAGHSVLLINLLGAGLVYSLFLAGISAFVLQTLCPLCTGMYAATLVGWLAAMKWAGRSPARAFRASLASVPAALREGGRGFLIAFAFLLITGMGVQQYTRTIPPRVPTPTSDVAAPVPMDQLLAPHVAIKGSPDAPVTIVEFSDFQCPFCSRLAEHLAIVQRELGEDRVRIVFRHLPLPFHDAAEPAALAALCAWQDGRFWELHDRLFAEGPRLNGDVIREQARLAGMDVEALDACMNHPDIRAQLQADRDAAAALGIRGTPTFFINGVQYVGAQPPSALRTLIQQAQDRAAE